MNRSTDEPPDVKPPALTVNPAARPRRLPTLCAWIAFRSAGTTGPTPDRQLGEAILVLLALRLGQHVA